MLITLPAEYANTDLSVKPLNPSLSTLILASNAKGHSLHNDLCYELGHGSGKLEQLTTVTLAEVDTFCTCTSKNELHFQGNKTWVKLGDLIQEVVSLEHQVNPLRIRNLSAQNLAEEMLGLIVSSDYEPKTWKKSYITYKQSTIESFGYKNLFEQKEKQYFQTFKQVILGQETALREELVKKAGIQLPEELKKQLKVIDPKTLTEVQTLLETANRNLANSKRQYLVSTSNSYVLSELYGVGEGKLALIPEPLEKLLPFARGEKTLAGELGSDIIEIAEKLYDPHTSSFNTVTKAVRGAKTLR